MTSQPGTDKWPYRSALLFLWPVVLFFPSQRHTVCFYLYESDENSKTGRMIDGCWVELARFLTTHQTPELHRSKFDYSSSPWQSFSLGFHENNFLWNSDGYHPRHVDFQPDPVAVIALNRSTQHRASSTQIYMIRIWFTSETNLLFQNGSWLSVVSDSDDLSHWFIDPVTDIKWYAGLYLFPLFSLVVIFSPWHLPYSLSTDEGLGFQTVIYHLKLSSKAK